MPTELDDLRAQLAAERAAHAAEVARLRAALKSAELRLERGYWSTRTFIDQKVPGWIRGDDSVSYPMLKGAAEVKAALAAPPTAAVEAVEDVVKALEQVAQHLPPLELINDLDDDKMSGKRLMTLNKQFTIAEMRSVFAALAAWKEANRG